MTKTCKSKILASVHEAMQDAHDVGVIDKTTMREFDTACLTEVAKLSPEEIVALREREGVSQAVLALHLKCCGEARGRVGARAEAPIWAVPETAVPHQGQRLGSRRVSGGMPMLFEVSDDKNDN